MQSRSAWDEDRTGSAQLRLSRPQTPPAEPAAPPPSRQARPTSPSEASTPSRVRPRSPSPPSASIFERLGVANPPPSQTRHKSPATKKRAFSNRHGPHDRARHSTKPSAELLPSAPSTSLAGKVDRLMADFDQKLSQEMETKIASHADRLEELLEAREDSILANHRRVLGL